MPVITQNLFKNALRTNLQWVPVGAAQYHGASSLNVWVFSDAANKNSVILPWNPAFDSDSDTNITGVSNKGINLGASQSYIQPVALHSPTRELGKGGNTLIIDRMTRYVLTAIFRQGFVDGYSLIQPRIPYTGYDDAARVFIDTFATKRMMIGGGDFYSCELSFTYYDIANYQ